MTVCTFLPILCHCAMINFILQSQHYIDMFLNDHTFFELIMEVFYDREMGYHDSGTYRR